MVKKLSLLAVFFIMLAFLSSCVTMSQMTSGGEGEYADYLAKVTYSKDHMPSVESLGAYTDLQITYKYTQDFAIIVLFETHSVGVFVSYDEDGFGEQTEYISKNYSFFESNPDENGTDHFATIAGYEITMVDAEYEFEIYKSCLLIGVNETEKKICYLFYYDFDRDSLTDLDGYIKETFCLK